MHCNHRCYECHIPACPDRIRQSIGPRIVPMFADPPEWSADKVYSPLTLVIHNGATYMSRRCVPANTALPDTDPFYNESWVMVYDMNAQVAQYREEVAQLSQQVTDFGGKIDNWEQLIVQWTALIQGWQNQFPELAKDLAAITERVAAIEPQLAQALEDITALQTTQQTHTEQIAANTQGLADLTPRVNAAETHLSALDEEQKVQDEHLNNLDASQTEQDTRIQANHDLAVQAKNTADNNTQQIAENAGKIAANAAEIAKHAERLESLETSQGEQDAKIQANTDDIAQAKANIAQAAAAAQQAQDTATHADAAASQAQTTAEAAQEAAQAAQTAADQAKADNTTQDGRLDALEAAQQQTAQDVANLKDGSTELPYVKKVNGNATGTLAVENISVSGTATVGEPVNDTDAASKKYVDQTVQNAAGGITPDVTKLKQDVAALQESQTTQDSQISAAKTTADQAAQDVASIKNGSTALPYIKDTGDTVTGDYDFTGGTVQVAAPTRPADAATKQYVDNAVGQATDPALTARVEALETSQTQQDTQIEAAKNAANQAQTAAQTAQEAAEAAQSTASQAKADNTTQDGRLDALEEEQSTQAEQIAALQSQIGSGGVHGNVTIADAVLINSSTGSVTVTKNEKDIYLITIYAGEQGGSNTAHNMVWQNGFEGNNIAGLYFQSILPTSLTFSTSSTYNRVVVFNKFTAK